ncbi:leucine-rich repeat domain-containing protein [Micromonospora sp. NBC_01796]|uniref:leucine-rich repeat domain-containing protein n=1 Tax=Micromonospora sp. NBC_01796 TaxID=2975987 RepID=UPI002DD86D47|nr:leucine-rich repeat domain-containing protein [Micromonospora sp. NBC_01796]WSA84309.1 leucine-rich repeat domain-containing protein [Micromonospora sp. NBC_01796]
MRPPSRVRFHAERQDTSLPAWQRLLEVVDEAATDGREVFKPLVELSPQERRDIITLPPTIARLTEVKHLNLYGSSLVRIPPEIGAMSSLEEFSPYTSSRLHWFPYELTRCPKLRNSTVSTRAIYGNFKYRPSFPELQPARSSTAGLDCAQLDPGTWGYDAIESCGVCQRPIGTAGLRQVWISLRIATDVLPLLVNACSPACVEALPTPPDDHVQRPHTGGPDLVQPPSYH